MIFYTVMVNEEERDLVADIINLEFGTISEIELSGGQRTIKLSVSEPQQRLLKLIHDGNSFFHLIKVHQREPAYAEAPYTTPFGKRKAIKLYKF